MIGCGFSPSVGFRYPGQHQNRIKLIHSVEQTGEGGISVDEKKYSKKLPDYIEIDFAISENVKLSAGFSFSFLIMFGVHEKIGFSIKILA